ncbi:Protein SGT1 [Portunus trituberculatus]|uniref:Protein SGT1 n=1 Tax=Portunus trituberculatus TaxID=210409 RepID=A0A5B7DRP9_PORTR|nr:Protein SGT1 [Portunus trituberculatus]
MLTTEDQYVEAIERITSEIKEKPDNPELFLLRSQNLLKLEKFKVVNGRGVFVVCVDVLCCSAHEEASSDASRAVDLGAGAEGHLVQGKALFNLGRFVEALEAFTKGKAKGGANLGKLDQFGQWISWCEDRIKKLGLSEASNPANSKSASEIFHLPHETSMEEKKEEAAGDAAATAPNEMPVPKIKHDWYQTEAFVIVTVLVKNLKQEDVKVDFTEKTVSVSAPLPSGSEYSLELDLCHPINPAQSSFRVVPSKIEIKMKKVDGIRWGALEGDGEPPSVKASIPGIGTSVRLFLYASALITLH